MMFGTHDYPPHNFAVLPSRCVAYDFKNRALVPSPELEEWLNYNVRGPWHVMAERTEDGSSNAIIRFVDERDTVLFKMWWQ